MFISSCYIQHIDTTTTQKKKLAKTKIRNLVLKLVLCYIFREKQLQKDFTEIHSHMEILFYFEIWPLKNQRSSLLKMWDLSVISENIVDISRYGLGNKNCSIYVMNQPDLPRPGLAMTVFDGLILS